MQKKEKKVKGKKNSVNLNKDFYLCFFVPK